MILKQKEVLIFALLIIAVIAINYSLLDKTLEKYLLDYEYKKVERVIDGDTLVIENKTSVRLLGINTPERGEFYYDEAKDFLKNLTLNQTVKLKYGKDRYDKYQRILAYVFLDNNNINLKLIENGFANYYFPSGKDVYYNEFKSAWEDCIEKNINLCKASESKCANCIILEKFDVKSQQVVLYNNCNYDCDLDGWTIKDEGRKKFAFEDFLLEKEKSAEITAEDFDVDYVWTEAGDTLFLRDDEGGLVLWESY